MTGKRRRFRETLARIEECATALSSPKRDGGLEIEPGSKEVVGILSENCMVGAVLGSLFSYHLILLSGVSYSGSRSAQDRRTRRLDPGTLASRSDICPPKASKR